MTRFNSHFFTLKISELTDCANYINDFWWLWIFGCKK